MKTKTIAVISDTHGLLRDEVRRLLAGADLIIHAGDVGKEEVLDEISTLSPELVAVRGNVDQEDWALRLPRTEFIEYEGLSCYIIHNLDMLDIDPQAAGVDIVVSGHTHRPCKKRINGVLYLNPGSAGPKRFYLPVTMARILKNGQKTEVEIINLEQP